MTLGFSQEIKGVKNFFVSKIWMGLLIDDKLKQYEYYWDRHVYSLGKPFDNPDDPIKPKLHTIRQGLGRWRAGMDIHMVINNRTSNRFQFAPTIKCKSVQDIQIKNVNHLSQHDPMVSVVVEHKSSMGFFLMAYQVTIDNKTINADTVKSLAINDGFDSVAAFFDYFNKNFTGTLIHWTDLKY